jgi:hypothetical protein
MTLGYRPRSINGKPDPRNEGSAQNKKETQNLASLRINSPRLAPTALRPA